MSLLAEASEGTPLAARGIQLVFHNLHFFLSLSSGCPWVVPGISKPSCLLINLVTKLFFSLVLGLSLIPFLRPSDSHSLNLYNPL